MNARIDEIAENEINDSIFSAEGDGWLGAVLCQRKQTASPASGKDKCDYVTWHLAHCSSPWRNLQQLSVKRPGATGPARRESK
jgi:hypothetical protein